MRPWTRVCCLLAWMSIPVQAGVTLDGSLGPKRNIQSGSVFSVLPSDGRFANNGVMFHSFGTLNLTKGQSLQFLGSNAAKLTVARVTGGQRSTINGEIVCFSDLVLVNRWGIVFGKDAKLGVSGSFAATTADEVRFADKTSFPARRESGAVLTIAAPIEAFGFTSARPAAISVSSSTTGLAVGKGRTLSLVGGDVAVRGAGVKLSALEGRVNLVSTASPGSVVMDPTARSSTVHVNVPIQGKLTVEGKDPDHAAEVRAEGPGGSILIRGGRLHLASGLLSTVTNAGNARGVNIAVQEEATIIGGLNQNQFLTAIDTLNSGTGRGGDIRISAGALSISGRAHLTANTSGPGRAGNISLSAASMHIRAARAESLSLGGGDCGTITLDAGRNGSIRLDGAGALGGEDVSGLVVDSQSTSGAGPGGSGGGIFLQARSLQIVDEAEVSALTKTGGRGGDITVRVSELMMDGLKRGPLKPGDTVTAIEARVGQDDAGTGGSIDIEADRVVVRNGAAISASTFGRGDGGTVRVVASQHILLDGAPEPFTGIFARTTRPRTAISRGGNGGDVLVRTPRLRIVGGGSISTQSTGNGRAGKIEVDLMNGDLTLDAGATIRSDSRRSGNAGNVRIFGAESIQVRHGSAIISSAQRATGGTIVINARDFSLSDQSSVSTSAQGNGGQIDFVVDRQFRAFRSSISTESRADGGQITIDPQVVALDHSRIITRGDAAGGDINVLGDRFLRSADSVLDASSARGNFGTIRITAPDIDLAGALLNIEASLFAPGLTLNEVCGRRMGAELSSFVTVGRSATPPQPGGLSISADLSGR